MLFGGGDVSVTAVGQFDHHCLLNRAAEFELHSREGVGLVRCRRDGDVADADRLLTDLGRLLLVENHLLAGVDLFGGLRGTVTHLGDDLFRPLQTLSIGHAVLQPHASFGHRQIGVRVVPDRLQTRLGDLNHVVRVAGDRPVLVEVGRLPRVVPPPDIAATPMRHEGHERRMVLALGRREQALKTFAEQPEVVRVQGLDTRKVVHRKVRQHRDRSPAQRLERDQRQVGIFRPRLTGHIVPVRSRVHIRPHGRIAERVVGHAVGTNDPATHSCVISCVLDRPADLSRFQMRLRLGNGVGNLHSQERHIRRIGIGPQTPHRRRRRVRVRRRDQHPIGPDLRSRRS